MTDILFQTGNNFSANLFAELSVQHENLVLSPFSILSTLCLLLLGSSGSTKQEIAKGLGIKNGDLDYIESYIEKFNHFKKQLKEDEKSFLFKDYIFLKQDKNIKINPNYNGKTEIEKVDFTEASKTANQINKKVKEGTGGLIKKIVDASSLSPSTILQFLNTVYFKGVWQHPFKEELIDEQDFTNSDNTKSNVDMLISKNDRLFAGFKKGEIEAKRVELPYLDSNLSMLVVLPSEKIDIDTFIKKLPEIQKELLHNGEMQETKVDFIMPKFKIDNDVLLNHALRRMGFEQIFSNADLKEMISTNLPVEVSDITHAAVIDVDEEGTKAAASTRVQVVSYSFVQTTQFVCDRPFLFFIIDRNTRFPLFTGAVKNLPDKYN